MSSQSVTNYHIFWGLVYINKPPLIKYILTLTHNFFQTVLKLLKFNGNDIIKLITYSVLQVVLVLTSTDMFLITHYNYPVRIQLQDITDVEKLNS